MLLINYFYCVYHCTRKNYGNWHAQGYWGIALAGDSPVLGRGTRAECCRSNYRDSLARDIGTGSFPGIQCFHTDHNYNAGRLWRGQTFRPGSRSVRIPGPESQCAPVFRFADFNMAIMDMAEIDPLMRGIGQVAKPGRRFVFSLTHSSKQQYSTKGAALESLPRKGWWRVLARLTFLMPVLAHHLHALSSFSIYQDTITSSRDRIQILVVLPCSKTEKRVAFQGQFLIMVLHV